MMMTFLINNISDDAQKKISGLFPSWPTIVATILATAILLIVLTNLVWKPVKDKVAQRQLYIQDNIDSSLKNQENTLLVRKQASDELIRAKTQASSIVSQAHIISQEHGEKIINSANQKAQRIMRDNDHEINRKRQAMQKDMEHEIVDIALSAASEIINKNMNNEANNRLIDKFINNAKQDKDFQELIDNSK